MGREGLAARVRRHRLALRMTQRQAALGAGVSLATWQSIERVGAEPSAFQELTLARVAHGLGMELDELLGADEHAAAGRGTATAVDVTGGGADGEAEALVRDLGRRLVRLAAVSPETFRLVTGQALEATERFLEVLED